MDTGAPRVLDMDPHSALLGYFIQADKYTLESDSSLVRARNPKTHRWHSYGLNEPMQHTDSYRRQPPTPTPQAAEQLPWSSHRVLCGQRADRACSLGNLWSLFNRRHMKIFTTRDRERQSNLDHLWHYIRADRGACDTGEKNGIGTKVGKKKKGKEKEGQ
jgi:hypothetical protein